MYCITTDASTMLSTCACLVAGANGPFRSQNMFKIQKYSNGVMNKNERTGQVALCVDVHEEKRPNDEENDLLKSASVCAFEYLYLSDPAGHTVNLLVLYALIHEC